jgi:hypothetical protein
VGPAGGWKSALAPFEVEGVAGMGGGSRIVDPFGERREQLLA